MKKKRKIRLIYVSTVTSEEKMNQIIKNSKMKPLQSIQKFHRLMCEGLVENGIEVETITAIPMSRGISSQLFWKEKNEKINGVKYRYLPFINMPVLRQICIMFFTICSVIKDAYKYGRDNIFICDLLNTTISTTTLVMSKLLRKKCIAIVTDLPRDIGNDRSISKKINEKFQCKYDGYIILTEAMNRIVNPNKKPYVVIEGIANIHMQNVANDLSNKYPEKVCIYAGGLYKKYGVDMLIRSFAKLKDENIRLYLYGDGELTNKIQQISDKRIKYLGVVPNNEVIKEEIKATLLINPRFTDEEYTRYSFPSKNMEYMSTGTPVLTTRLAGMPKEYYDYVYLFDEENENGYCNKLKEILSLPKEELYEKGKKSKEFVLKNKNNIVQAKKIEKMIINI